MLRYLPNHIKINPDISESFLRLSPLTIEQFQHCAGSKGLRKPCGEHDEWKLKMKKDSLGNCEMGQYDVKTNEPCGVIRKISAAGDILTEQIMFGSVATGLSR